MLKLRGILLVALMIGGAFVMMQSYQDTEEKTVHDLLIHMELPFQSLTFTKPPMNGVDGRTWHVQKPEEIEALLTFLSHVAVRKVDPQEVNLFDEVTHFSIQLNDDLGQSLNILINENLIIQDSVLYYEMIDGPLHVDWLVTFFMMNE